MKKNLRLLMTTLLCAVFGTAMAQTPEVTLDFTTNEEWQLPEGSSNKATETATFTNNDGYAITLSAQTGYYFNTQGYLMLGKMGSTLTLPKFNFAVGSIEVVGNSAASAAVVQNIFVNDTEVSTQTEGAKGSNVYAIAANYQAAGNIYTLKVLSDHNTQITKINIYKAGGGTVKPVPNMSFNPATTTAIINEDFTEPVLSYDGDGTVTYSSEDENIATVNSSTGEVTAKKAGSTNIVATATETANYKGASASYKLTVVDSQSGEVQDGVFDFTGFTDYGTGLTPNSDSSSDSYIYNDYTWTAGNVTLVTSGKYRWWLAGAGNTLRLYNNMVDDVQTSKITISVPSGNVITAISVTGGQQLASDDGLYSSSNGKWEGEAQSVILRYAASSGNVAIKTITVTYSSGTTTQKEKPTMKFSGTYYTVILGDDFTAPELTYTGDGRVTYSSDNEEAVTVNPSTGVVDVVGVGTAKITASATETANFEAATASYTINVTEAQGTHEVVDGTFDFTDATNYGSGLTPSTSDEYLSGSVTWTAGNVKLVSSGKHRWWLNANGNTLRFYYDKDNAENSGKFVVSVPSGKEITEIVITGGTKFKTNTGVYSNGTWSGNAQSVEFTIDGTDGQYVKTVTVTYGNPGAQKVDPQLAWSVETLEIVKGESFTAPTLTAAAGFDMSIVTYSSSNQSVATIDESGVLEIKGVGNATITATSPATTTFLPGTASYQLIVNRPEATPGTDKYTLVADASTLANGDKIIIVGSHTPKAQEGEEAETSYFALGITQKTNNREGIAVEMNDDGTITPNSDVQVITLETGWYLNVGDGYLYAAGSNKSNYLRTEAEKDADNNAKAAITTTDGVTSIIFQGTNTNNDMRFNYNGGTTLFACYAPTNTSMPNVSIYRKVAGQNLIGDVNGDGEVNITDISLTVEYVLTDKASPFIFANADTNGDGDINVTDISAIVDIVLGKQTE